MYVDDDLDEDDLNLNDSDNDEHYNDGEIPQ